MENSADGIGFRVLLKNTQALPLPLAGGRLSFGKNRASGDHLTLYVHIKDG